MLNGEFALCCCVKPIGWYVSAKDGMEKGTGMRENALYDTVKSREIHYLRRWRHP